MTSPTRDLAETARLLRESFARGRSSAAPLRIGRTFRYLRSRGMIDAEIARQVGVSRVYVGQLIALAELPDGITHLVESGSISATLALETVKAFHRDTDAAFRALSKAVSLARAGGVKRASARHLREILDGGEHDGAMRSFHRWTPAPRPHLRDRLRRLLQEADHDPRCGTVTLELRRDEYEEVKALVAAL